MARRRVGSHRLDSDYTEEVVAAALESYLTLLTFPRLRYSIEPFSRADERILGADARLHSSIAGFRPFYMQFKRPAAYPDFSTSHIVTDRKRLNLEVEPHTLFFPLRKKQAHHSDFQHNLLLKLRDFLRAGGMGDAAYVCPLFLERSAYRLQLHWAGLSRWIRFWRPYPWDFEDVLVEVSSGTIRFDRVPLFAEHVTIPPHAPVLNADHAYSFTDTGRDLCFHSPDAVPGGIRSLAKFLAEMSSGFSDRPTMIGTKDANNRLTELIQACGEADAQPLATAPDDPIARWLVWGEYLRGRYQIEQYAVISWGD